MSHSGKVKGGQGHHDGKKDSLYEGARDGGGSAGLGGR